MIRRKPVRRVRFRKPLFVLVVGILVYLYVNRQHIHSVESVVSLAMTSLSLPDVTKPPQQSGQAQIIDGDTLSLSGQKIRLYGIDAPEMAQKCQDANRQRYHCGQRSKEALRALVDQQTVRCHAKAKDKYGRVVAICVAGSTEINRWMVRHGHAVAYRSITKAYVAEEEIAKSQRLGLWSGSFKLPWLWRKTQGK